MGSGEPPKQGDVAELIGAGGGNLGKQLGLAGIPRFQCRAVGLWASA
jgi:hypothetical protein